MTLCQDAAKSAPRRCCTVMTAPQLPMHVGGWGQAGVNQVQEVVYPFSCQLWVQGDVEDWRQGRSASERAARMKAS